jgi:hypothetical protein
VQVYQALVRPLLEYGAEVTSLHAWPGAARLHVAVGKRILQCPLQTATVAVLGELGWSSMEARWQQLRLGLWARVLRMPPDAPARVVYEETLRTFQHPLHGACEADGVHAVSAEDGWSVLRHPEYAHSAAPHVATLWCAQIQRDLYTLGMADVWDGQPDSVTGMQSMDAWKRRVRTAVFVREQAWWWAQVRSHASLQAYAALKAGHGLRLEPYLEVWHRGWADRTRIGRVATTRLRTGSNDLRVHSGEWHRLDRELRTCTLCGGGVEDERHFLLLCVRLRDRRTRLGQRIDALVHASNPAQSPSASSDPFCFAQLSCDDRFAILCCAPLPAVAMANCDGALTRMVLTEVGSWWLIRRRHQLLLRAIAGAQT